MLHSHMVLLRSTSSTMPNCTIRHILRGVISIAEAEGHEAVQVPHWTQVLRWCPTGVRRSPNAKSRLMSVRTITSDVATGCLLAGCEPIFPDERLRTASICIKTDHVKNKKQETHVTDTTSPIQV